MTKKILIVEDEFIVANNLRLILKEAGYTISGIAASAKEAQECILQHKPDLVLLDIRIKGKLSGIDVARKLRADYIPFIYLSANSDQAILEEAKKTEPYGFLIKPVREKDLLVALEIAWYLHQHSLESKLRREEKLKQELTILSAQELDLQEKFLRLSKILQAHIPFDLITTGLRPSHSGTFNDIAYLRVGLGEYQFIGKKELLTISGISNDALEVVMHDKIEAGEATFYDNEAGTQQEDIKPLQQLMIDCFVMQSFLFFPVSLGYGLAANYFFYSKKNKAYNKEHIDLLQLLGNGLEALAEQLLFAAPTNVNANTVAQKRNNQTSRAVESLFDTIVGSHHSLLSALDLATQVAPYTTSVLLLGESGTGKEKVAQLIHNLSPRKKAAYIKVNCAAIPPTLVESELFGHEKGAFTGAVEKRKGKFEQAHGGTIFLDEIGELPLAVQVKLLRVLQEREIEPVGGSSPIKTDIRIIAATNRNIEQQVAKGRFRLDLFYRLNVFPITLPSLRERKSDIEALSHFFAKRFCKAFEKSFHGIESTMLEAMNAYDWPGNIRELENVVEQCVVLNDGSSPLQLKRSLTVNNPELTSKQEITSLEQIKNVQRETEKEYLSSILKKTKGRIRGLNGAAELLNIKPTTLEAKMAKLDINKNDFTDNNSGE